MSLISEALHKAQQERQARASDQEAVKLPEKSSPRLRPALLILAAAVLIFCAALLLFMQSRQAKERPAPLPVRAALTGELEQANPTVAEAAVSAAVEGEQPPAQASEPEKQPDALVKPDSAQQHSAPPKPEPAPARVADNPEPAGEPQIARRKQNGSVWRSHLEEAGRLQKSGRNDEAIEQLRQALALARQPDIYAQLAALLTAESHHLLALDYLEEALQIFPDHYHLRKAAVAAAIRARAFDRGLLHLDRALRLNPEDPALHTYLGLCRFHNQDFAAARDSFQRSLSLQPTGHHNLYYLGLIEDNLRRYREALRLYRLFLERNDPAADFRHRDWLQQRIRTIEEFLASE